jgi:hypothetical protein
MLVLLPVSHAAGGSVSGSYGDPGDAYLEYTISGADFSLDADGAPHHVGTYLGTPIRLSGKMIVARPEGLRSTVTMSANLGDQSAQWPQPGEDNTVENKTVQMPFDLTFAVPAGYTGEEVTGSANLTVCGGTCGVYEIKLTVKLSAPEDPKPKPYVIAAGFHEGEGTHRAFIKEVIVNGVEDTTAKNTLLYAGTRVKTGPGVEILMQFPTTAEFRLKENSEFEIEARKMETTPTKVVMGRLWKGICNFYFPPGEAGAKKFEVATHRAITSIKGTRFTLSHLNCLTTVDVQEGVVEVTEIETGAVHQVPAGETISVGSVGCTSPEHTITDRIWRPGPGFNDGTDDGSVKAGKDTYTYGHEDWVNSNMGDFPDISGSGQSNCNNAETIAYLQFNVADLPGDPLSVNLGVTHRAQTTYCYSHCDVDFYFYRVTQPWNEMTTTAANAPSVDTAHPALGPLPMSFPSDLGTVEYDITEIYREWKNSTVPNHGMAIFSPSVGCNNAAIQFSIFSSDEANAARRPYLRVVYRGPAYPINFRHTLMDQLLTLAWEEAPGATGYKLAFGFSPGNYAGVLEMGNVTSFGALDVSGLPVGTYYLALKAYNGDGESAYSNEIAVTMGSQSQATLAAPANLRYTLEGTILTLVWDPVNGAAGYRIGLGLASGSYGGFSDLGNISQLGPLDLSGVTGTYYVVIRAYSGNSESGNSNEIVVKLGP